MLDERRNPGRPSFFVRPTEPFSPDGRRAIRTRVEPLFQAVMQEYGPNSPNPIFRGSEEIRLTDRALAFLVSELARYDFTRTPIDAKGIAYQELVGTNLRGDRGQYFTPRRAINLMVEIFDPKEDETVLDPACGTGGFLRAALDHQLNRWREADRAEGQRQIAEDLANYEDRLRRYAEQRLFGADFDESLVRAASMNLMLMAKTAGNVFHLDSLLFPEGDLPGVKPARAKLPDQVRVLMTNPPFGSDIPVTDPAVLQKYRSGVARTWRRQDGRVQPTGEAGSVAPEVLFVQRCVEWLESGGRLGIVLPNGLLSNPGPNDQGVREWIMQECWVLASVELPVETFIVEANVNILTTLLFLKRKTEDERIADSLRGEVDYPVFMAVAERVGVDRRGNPLYKRRPDGEEIWERPPDEEFLLNGRLEHRRRPRQRVLDDVCRTPASVNSITRLGRTHGVNLQGDRGGRSGYPQAVGRGPAQGLDSVVRGPGAGGLGDSGPGTP
jgi:type I restriction enzyme M protein